MNTTSNLHLKKPSGTDPIDISVLNENADTLDAFAGDVNDALAAKQDTISDLSGIRSGAAAGATAVQPAEFEADQQRQDALEAEDRAALIAQVDGGAKNLFNINATPIVNHTTYTLTGEKLTVSASGTWAHYSVPIDLPAGDYILSMIISDYNKTSEAPDTSMRLRMAATTSGGASIVLQTITGNGTMSVPFTWNGGTLYVQFYSNYSATLYANSLSAEDVMICTAADYSISPAFVPYRPSWQELYEMVLALQNGA